MVLGTSIVPLLNCNIDIHQIINIFSFEKDAIINMSQLKTQIARQFLNCEEDDIGFEFAGLDANGYAQFKYTDTYRKARKFLKDEVGYTMIERRNYPSFSVRSDKLDNLIKFSMTLKNREIVRSSLSKYKEEFYLKIVSPSEQLICNPFIYARDFGKVSKDVPEQADVMMEKDAVDSLRSVGMQAQAV